MVHGLGIGGTERVVCDLVRAFNDDEFKTSVCCLDELGAFGEDLISEGYDVLVLNRRPGVDLDLARRLRQTYTEQNADIIHSHQYTPYFYSALASLFSGRKPVIFTEHGRHYPDRLRLRRAFFNQLLRPTTFAYTGVSEFTRQSLIRYERMPAGRIRTIYNGVRPNGNGPASGKEQARSSLGLSESDLLILSIGRMDPVKDFGTMIRAFADISVSFPHASLWIAGGGDETYCRNLAGLIDNLKLREKATLLGNRRDTRELLSACDLFVLPSITEAASMTLLEAMSAGKAVIATNTGGNPEIVAHEETGLLVDAGAPVGMADAMKRLLADADLRLKMGKAGYRRLEENFAMGTILQQYKELYVEAAG